MAQINSAGTTDTRVDRPEEGLPGVANVANPTANPPSRATFDAGIASAPNAVHAKATIDTTQTSGSSAPYNTKQADPNAW